MIKEKSQIFGLTLLRDSGTRGDTYLQVWKGGMVCSVLSVSHFSLPSKKEKNNPKPYAYLAFRLLLSDSLSRIQSTF